MVTLWTMSMTSVYADQHSAMLQQGDSIALFYGADALNQAYAVADSGAVITLSKGDFTGLSIDKSITLIGYYGFSDQPAEGTVIAGDVTITANKVTVDGIRITGTLILGDISNCIIRHSGLNKFGASDNSKMHVNTILDQSYVKETILKSLCEKGKDLVIKNSTVRTQNSQIDNPDNPVYFTNNVIYMLDGNYATTDYMLPYAVYVNNIIVYNGFSNGEGDGKSSVLSQRYPSTYINNGWCRGSYNSYNQTRSYGTTASVVDDVQIDLKNILSGSDQTYNVPYPTYPNDPGLGSDGTPRGPLGGSGFTDRPSIPRIISREIGVNPDVEGKLNVKITVSAE